MVSSVTSGRRRVRETRTARIFRLRTRPDAESCGRVQPLRARINLLQTGKPEAFDVRLEIRDHCWGPEGYENAPTDSRSRTPSWSAPQETSEAVQAQNFEFGPVVYYLHLLLRGESIGWAQGVRVPS